MADVASEIIQRNGKASAAEQKALGVVIHHTAGASKEGASATDDADTLKGIAKHHSAKGWKDIGYNFVVMRSGRIHEGRRGSFASAKAGKCRRGAHAGKGSLFNKTHIGVSLQGTFTSEDTIPEKQRDALVRLLVWIADRCGFESTAIVTHRDVREKPTACPGISPKTVSAVRADVVQAQKAAAAADTETVDIVLGAQAVSLPRSAPDRVDLLGDGLLSYEREGQQWAPAGPLGALVSADAPPSDAEGDLMRLGWVDFEGGQGLALPFAEGSAELEVKGSLRLEYATSSRELTLVAKAGSRVTLRFMLALRANIGHGPVSADAGLQAAWSEALPLGKPGELPFETSLQPSENLALLRVRLPSAGSAPDDWDFEGGEWFARNRLALAIDAGPALSMTVRGFDGLGFGDLVLTAQSWSYQPASGAQGAAGVRVEGVEAYFMSQPDAKLEADAIVADQTFHVAAHAGRFELLLHRSDGWAINADEASSVGGFTLVVHKGTVFVLVLSSSRVSLEARAPSGQRVATVAVPPLDRAAVDALVDSTSDELGASTGKSRHLLFGIRGGTDSTLSLGSTGIHATATVSPITLELGDELADVSLEEGRLELTGKRWSASATATARLPWLRGARGQLTFEAGSALESLAVDARFDVPLGDVWRDPSGALAFHEPAASVQVRWDGGWTVDGALRGELRFDPRVIAADAQDAASEIFDNLSLTFEGLSLRSLGRLGSGDGESPRVALSLLNSFEDDLWDVFRFKLSELRLTRGGIGLGGSVGFDLGPVAFGGRLPGLDFSLSDGGGVAFSDDFEFAIDGTLKLAGGIEANMSFSRRKDAQLEALEGTGDLRIPGWGDFGVSLSIGRTRGERRKPSVFFFGELELVQPLYPGVVLRSVGLGLGINRGFGDDLTGRPVDAVIASLREQGSQDVRNPDSWHVREGIQLAMRGMFSATTGAKSQPDIYVADLTGTLDHRFRLTAAIDGWAYTSLEDVAKPAFRAAPYVRAALMIDPKGPTLTAGMVTLRGSKNSLDGSPGKLVSSMLDAGELEAGLRADRSRFALRIQQRGPVDVLGVEVNATQALALCASSRGAWMAGRVSARVSESVEGGVSAGIVSAHVRASASVDGELGVLGGIVERNLQLYGVARLSARFSLNASLRIRLSFRVKIGPFKVRVRIRIKALSVSVGLSAELLVRAALGRHSGFVLTARFGARLAGYHLTIPFSVRKNAGAVDAAHAAYRAAITSGGSL